MKWSCLAFALCLLWPAPARAQGPPQSEPLTLIGGVSFGLAGTWFSPEGLEIAAGPAGPIVAPGAEQSLARNAFFGLVVSRRLTVVYHSDFTRAGPGDVGSRVRTVDARWRLGPRVWVGGGAGWGSLRYEPGSGGDTITLTRGLALDAAAGVELLHGKLFALDLTARMSTASYGPLRVTRAAILMGYAVWVPLG